MTASVMTGFLPGTREPMFLTQGGMVAATERRRVKVKTHPWRYLIIIVTGILGALVSIGMCTAIGGWQAHLAELHFTSLARDRLQTLNSGLTDATDLLYSMRAYFESRDHRPSRSEFQAFSGALRERVPGLRDTGWAPRVTAADRDAFEREIRATGMPDFQIVERNANGKLVRAGAREVYFPILYSDPGAINRPILGFDLASEPMRSRTIGHAIATDRPAATPPVTLMNIQRPNGGTMGFTPVHDGDAAPGTTLRPVTGVLLGAYETAAMIRNILAAKLRLGDLDIYIFDPDGPANNPPIYWLAAGGEAAPTEAAILARRHWQGTLELLDQRWGIIFAPSDAYGGEAWDWIALAVLAGGLVMTASLVGYLWFSLRRTQQLEALATSLRDTTEELRHNAAKLDHLAHHDALTGLPNRTAFRHEVGGALHRARRGQSLAVLYLDLDRFKAVNDTLGHPAGDRLLCEVADRLRGTVRAVDAITRLGGDEFAISQSAVEQPQSAETLARRLIDTLSLPYNIDGHLVAVGVSVGITLVGRGDLDVDQLLRRADMALYAAKRGGRGTWRHYEPAMDHDAQARQGLEMDLRRALEQDSFELYYQPLVTIADGRVRGFEALLRWHHPTRGMVQPGDFLRCAEETGLIVPIGAWVLRTALTQAADWPADVQVAVNVSPRQLARDDFADVVEATLAETGQTGARLELEISENALLGPNAPANATLQRLRALGVQVAMDDFGTGHASLSHIHSFAFDRIKIDQSFVGSMTETPQSGAIVRAILQLATSLGIATTAEGVETPAQLEQLAAAGCGEAQGFLFSLPRPAGEVPRLLRGWSPVAQRDVVSSRNFDRDPVGSA